MTNYVLTYRLDNHHDSMEFLEALKEQFPENQIEVRHDIPYFAFAARNLPQVEETIDMLLRTIRITDADYVGLYYLKNEETEKIKRLMVLGPADLVEKNLTISSAEHENLLSDLFDIDFMKLRFQNENKR